jgi:hypothetical protein
MWRQALRVLRLRAIARLSRLAAENERQQAAERPRAEPWRTPWEGDDVALAKVAQWWAEGGGGADAGERRAATLLRLCIYVAAQPGGSVDLGSDWRGMLLDEYQGMDDDKRELGAKMALGRKVGAVGPVRAAAAKVLAKHPDWTNQQVWDELARRHAESARAQPLWYVRAGDRFEYHGRTKLQSVRRTSFETLMTKVRNPKQPGD